MYWVLAIAALIVFLSASCAAPATVQPPARAATPVTARPTNVPPPQPAAAAPTPKLASTIPGDFALVGAQNGVVSLSAADVSDGRARFYTIQAKGKVIPFFVVKGPDGVIRAAFDACDICYAAKKGYHQEGDVMVCNNCGNTFPIELINVERGGCNPSPLPLTQQGDALVLQLADIEAGARYF